MEPKKKSGRFVRFLKRLVAAPFVFLAAVFILIEDWLWDDLARFAAAVGRLPVFRQIESFIVKLPPYAALAFFAAPSLLLIPVKLLAIYFISHGRTTLGMLTIIAAKVAGTALVARIFTLTRPKLMGISWFAWLYERFTAFKARIYSAIKSTAIYEAAHNLRLKVSERLKLWRARRRGFWRRRFAAALKLSRRRKQEVK